MSKAGLRITMIGLGLPFGLGIILITFSRDATMLLIGRFLYGLSSGAFGLLVPSYTSETAEPRIKGAMGSLLVAMIITILASCGGTHAQEPKISLSYSDITPQLTVNTSQGISDFTSSIFNPSLLRSQSLIH